MIKKGFAEIYDPKRTSYADFDDIFQQLKREAETRAEEMKKSKQLTKSMNNNNLGRKQEQVQNGTTDGGNQKKNDGESGKGDGRLLGDENPRNNKNNINNNNAGKGEMANGNGKENAASVNGAFDVNKLQQKLRSKGGKKPESVVKNKVSKAEVETKKKMTKKNRVWDDAPKDTKLDFTDPGNGNGEENIISVVTADEGESMMDKDEIVSSDSETEEEEEKMGNDSGVDAKKKGWFSSMFQRLCMIGLAPSHVAFKEKGGIASVDFNVGKSDRSVNCKKGKWLSKSEARRDRCYCECEGIRLCYSRMGVPVNSRMVEHSLCNSYAGY